MRPPLICEPAVTAATKPMASGLPHWTPRELVAFEEDIAKEFNASKIKAPVHLYYGNENEIIDVFNNFNVIPKYCFGCFKVLIEPNNVVDLIKLYFVFDNLNLKNDNTRKCMIELRSNISGSYKGYIYCSSLNEANEIREQVDKTVKKKIEKSIPISVKRGCSEFGISYPEYKKINDSNSKLMKYNKEWKEKEKLIDSKRSKPPSRRVNVHIPHRRFGTERKHRNPYRVPFQKTLRKHKGNLIHSGYIFGHQTFFALVTKMVTKLVTKTFW